MAGELAVVKGNRLNINPVRNESFAFVFGLSPQHEDSRAKQWTDATRTCKAKQCLARFSS